MFVREEAQLAVAFAAAEVRLAALARCGWLLSASDVAYAAGTADLGKRAAPGSGPTMPRPVRVHVRELIARRDSAGLALRWEAAGPGGGLFPALDADLMLSPAGEQATTLALAGVYRIPAVNAGDRPGLPALRRMAGETIRTFVDLVAAAVTAPVPGAERDGGPAGGGDPRPSAFHAP
jgi:hypothetical protein